MSGTRLLSHWNTWCSDLTAHPWLTTFWLCVALTLDYHNPILHFIWPCYYKPVCASTTTTLSLTGDFHIGCWSVQRTGSGNTFMGHLCIFFVDQHTNDNFGNVYHTTYVKKKTREGGAKEGRWGEWGFFLLPKKKLLWFFLLNCIHMNMNWILKNILFLPMNCCGMNDKVAE